MSFKVLIPYNFTPNDNKSIDFAGRRYGEYEEVEITLFHAFTPVPEMTIKETPVMKKVVHNAAILQLRQNERKKKLEAAREKLMTYGIDGRSIHCIFTPVKVDVAMDLVRLWREGTYDVVILNRNPGNIVNFFSRSISKRIAQHTEGGIGLYIVN